MIKPLQILAGLLLTAALTGNSQALVVLTIDITNPADVILKASSNLSVGNSDLTTIEGFTIEDFFRSIQDVTSSTIPTGDLGPIGQVVKYDGYQTFDFSALHRDDACGPFQHAAALPLPGTTGTVHAGYLQSGEGNQGVTLGQWQVVPEPGAVVLTAADRCASPCAGDDSEVWAEPGEPRGGNWSRNSFSVLRSPMTTKLDKSLKREFEINGKPHMLTINGDGLKLTEKGRRKGVQLQWKDLVSGEAALAVALNASLGEY